MNKYLLATIAIGLLGTSVAMPVYAQDKAGQTAVTVEIDLSDLDIADSQDMERLQDRIETAVRRVCPKRFEGPVKKYPDPRRCRQEAWKGVEQQFATIAARIDAGQSVHGNLAVTTALGNRPRK